MTFAWAVEFARADGSLVCRAPLRPDWEAASIWVRFEGIRRGLLPPVLTSEPGEVEPVWAEEGPPEVAAVWLTVRAPDGGMEPVGGEGASRRIAGEHAGSSEVVNGEIASSEIASSEVVNSEFVNGEIANSEVVNSEVRGSRPGRVRRGIPAVYLSRQVRALARGLIGAGRIPPREVVFPRLCAFPFGAPEGAGAADPAGAEQGEGGRDGGGLAIAEIPRLLSLVATPLARFTSGAEACALLAGVDDVPVFLPRAVLAQAEALARAAAEVETGGVLVGRLHQDPALPEIFVEVTAQIPARHAIAEQARLTFTPETWAAAEAAIATRAQGEELVGWWHYHPDFCRNCPPERRRDCTLDSAFFSADDVTVHHLCFGQAHQVALLISARPSGALERSLFGWRRGVVASRGYYLTGRRRVALHDGAPRESAPREAAPRKGAPDEDAVHEGGRT